MFGAVSRSHDDAPLVRAKINDFAIDDASIPAGQGEDHLSKPAPARFARFSKRILIPSRSALHDDDFFGYGIARIANDRPRCQYFAARHPQRRVVLFDEPAGKAGVIGVKMRAEYARHGAVGQRTGEKRFPRVAAHIHLQPGIDDRDAVIVIVEQPAVDVPE